MSARRIGSVLAAAVLLTAALSACSTTVTGTGQAATGAPQSGDFPHGSSGSSSTPVPTDTPTQQSTSPGPTSTSTAGPAGTFECPTVTYPYAHLTFDCIVDGLTLNSTNDIWPVIMRKTVEPSTGWVLEEGAGNWGDPAGKTPAAIALEVRGKMISSGGYGTTPTVTTVSSTDPTVGGRSGHVLQTTVTLNPAWAKTRGTKVTSEKLWIVVVKVTAADYTLWYTSIPNLASDAWAKVPAIIQTIRVG